MDLSVAILTWNTHDTLVKTLKILERELIDIGAEIIVVDNGSTDGCENFADFRFPQNRGISIGKNKCIDLSEGKYVLLLDGDVVPVPNSIRLMLKHMMEHPECEALGMFPNKFALESNDTGQKHHEDYCHELVGINKDCHCTCLFYGLYNRVIFDVGLRLREDGVFGEPGYGWEDHDFYQQMKAMGYDQWTAFINHPGGKYYHKINSSIRNMGRDQYMNSSRERHKLFRQRWERHATTG